MRGKNSIASEEEAKKLFRWKQQKCEAKKLIDNNKISIRQFN